MHWVQQIISKDWPFTSLHNSILKKKSCLHFQLNAAIWQPFPLVSHIHGKITPITPRTNLIQHLSHTELRSQNYAKWKPSETMVKLHFICKKIWYTGIRASKLMLPSFSFLVDQDQFYFSILSTLRFYCWLVYC